MDSVKRTFRKHLVDNGLASIAEMEAGISWNQHHQYPLVSRPLQKSASLKNISWGSSFVSTPRSPMISFHGGGRFCEEDQETHFLDSCFLCKKPLAGPTDIFMYRGDVPFCSEDCREEQIEMDEAEEKSMNLSASMRAMRKIEQTKSSFPGKSIQSFNFRSGTVAAASR